MWNEKEHKASDEILRRASGMTDSELRAAGYTLAELTDEERESVQAALSSKREQQAIESPRRGIAWGGSDHGLTIEQMQFARRILHAILREIPDVDVFVDSYGCITKPEGLARFEQTLVEALHAYDTYRTERLKELERQIQNFVDTTPRMVLWPEKENR
jgi:hypothetical protein